MKFTKKTDWHTSCNCFVDKFYDNNTKSLNKITNFYIFMKTIYYFTAKAIFTLAVLFTSLNSSAQALVGIKDCGNGFHHNLLISLTDTLYVFGENTYGQCGTGNTNDVLSPFCLNVKAIGVAGGYDFSFYIKTDSTIMATGRNSQGNLGIGNTTNQNSWTAVNLSSAIHFKQVAASGTHAVALTGNGLVYAWGDNASGQLGDNTGADRSSPVQVQKSTGGNLTNIKKVAAGSPGTAGLTANSAGHSIALASDGTVWTWGENGSGQLGDNSTTDRNRAVQVVGIGGTGVLSNVIDIAASGNSSYALLSDSTVVSWGGNSNGQLGSGNTTSRNFPGRVLVSAGTNITSVKQITASGAAVSDDVLAMLKRDGKIWNVGDNGKGQLGTGNTTNSSFAVQNTPALNRTFLKVIGTGHYLMQLSADTIGNYCESGHQTNGSFGNGTASNANITTATCLTIPIANLPVTLSTFTGKRTDDKTVVLRWSTESEISNDRFDIEYSADGREFDVIGDVKGNGTSFNTNDYQFVHKEAASNSVAYYRLKQVDFNGNFEYHKVIVVKPAVESNVYTSPNPTKGYLTVNMAEETNTDYTISIMDQTGRVLVERTGHIDSNPVGEKFDLNGYDRGFYFVTITTSFGTKVETIAKQ